MILLDSSVLIDLFRKKNKQNSLFFKLSKIEEDFSISIVTHYEIGIGNKKSPETSEKGFWDEFYDGLTVLPFDRACSDKAIEIYLDLRKRNKMIDMADLFIGATAIVYDYPLATLNQKHFERISDIDLQD